MTNVVSMPEFKPKPVNLPGALAALCLHYLAYLSRRGYALNTVEATRRDLEQFAGYLSGLGVTYIQHVTTHLVDGFLDALLAGEGNSPRTAARKLASVRGLFRYAASEGLVAAQADPSRAVRSPRWRAEPPIAPEEGALLRVIEGIDPGSPIGLRDRALFRLMFDGGLRVSAVVSLDLYDAADPPRACILPGGQVRYANKGGGSKFAVIDDTTQAWVEQWLQARPMMVGDRRESALFVGRGGRRLGRHAVLERIKKHARAAGLSQLTNHLLRHRRLGDLLERCGPDAAFVQSGHANRATTVNTYGHRALEASQQVIRTRGKLGAYNDDEVCHG